MGIKKLKNANAHKEPRYAHKCMLCVHVWMDVHTLCICDTQQITLHTTGICYIIITVLTVQLQSQCPPVNTSVLDVPRDCVCVAVFNAWGADVGNKGYSV